MLILSACFSIFSLAFNNNFTYYKESKLILENPLLNNATWNGLASFFSFDNIRKYDYQPIVIFSWALEHRNFGHNPFFFIFNNICLHLLNIALVFIFFLRFTRRRMPVTLIITLLFAIHPMSTDTVVGISGRGELLSMFFYLIALIQYHAFAQKNDWKRFSYAISGVMFLLAVLAKPEACFFVVTMFCVDYFVDEKWTWNRLFEKIPFFAVTCLGLWLLLGKVQDTLIETSWVEQLIFGCYAFLTHIWKSILPMNLSVFHPYPFKVGSLLPSVYYVAVVGTILLLTMMLRSLKRNKETSFGILLFLSALLPVCFIPMAGQVMTDSNGYLAYVGLFFLIAKAYERIMGDQLISKGILIKAFINCILIGYMCWMIGLTQERCYAWRNDKTLWADVLDQYPFSSVAHVYMGDAWHRKWFYENAVDHYGKAIKIDPKNIVALNNMGQSYLLNGKLDEALSSLNRCIDLDNQYWDAYVNRASVYEKMGQIDLAIEDYFVAISIAPYESEIYVQRGVLFVQKKQYDLALIDFEQALELDSKNQEALLYAHKLKNK